MQTRASVYPYVKWGGFFMGWSGACSVCSRFRGEQDTPLHWKQAWGTRPMAHDAIAPRRVKWGTSLVCGED